MQAIWSFGCSLAITTSSLIGLHLGRDFPMTLLQLGYVFQNSMLEYKTP